MGRLFNIVIVANIMFLFPRAVIWVNVLLIVLVDWPVAAASCLGVNDASAEYTPANANVRGSGDPLAI